MSKTNPTPWPHFWPHELACHCGECGLGWHEMDDNFMSMLEKLRGYYGKPLIITSAIRCPAYNALVSSTGSDGPHTTGRAVDIAISGTNAYRLVDLAFEVGFTGIGLHQRGPFQSRFVHLDNLTAADGYPRPRLWTYP